jgi:hypothetical protein
MEKRRVLLICSQHLLGESMEQVLRCVEDMQLIGPWEANEQVAACIPEVRPDVVVIVEGGENDPAASLTASLMETYPELPVIRAGLTENSFRIFSTHLLPARPGDLVQAILSLPAWEPRQAGNQSTKGEGCDENKEHPLVYAPYPDGNPVVGDHSDRPGGADSPGPGERGEDL